MVAVMSGSDYQGAGSPGGAPAVSLSGWMQNGKMSPMQPERQIMNRNRKHTPKAFTREMPLAYWLGHLRRIETEEQGAIVAGADPDALARLASSLGDTLLSIARLSFGELREAGPALPEVERYLTHTGRYVEPAHT